MVRVYLITASRSQFQALGGLNSLKSAESKAIQILVQEARVGLNSNEPHIVDFTNGWCSGPVVCINAQVPPGVLSCDLELLSHLVTAPVNIIDRLKGNLTPTEIQLNSLRANREFIRYIDKLYVV